MPTVSPLLLSATTADGDGNSEADDEDYETDEDQLDDSDVEFQLAGEWTEEEKKAFHTALRRRLLGVAAEGRAFRSMPEFDEVFGNSDDELDDGTDVEDEDERNIQDEGIGCQQNAVPAPLNEKNMVRVFPLL